MTKVERLIRIWYGYEWQGWARVSQDYCSWYYCNVSAAYVNRIISASLSTVSVGAYVLDLSPSPSVGLCVCVRKVYCGKTADWIRMPFGMASGVGHGMGVVDEALRAPSGRGGCGNLASPFTPLIWMAYFYTLHQNSKSTNILKATLRRRFSYWTAAHYLMHSAEGCATSRRNCQ